MNDNVSPLDKHGKRADGSPRRILVVGLGGGGCNAVSRIHGNWKGGPECVALDTDEQALATCEGARTLQLGKNLTQGAGAGSDAVVGRLAADDDLDLLRDLLRDTDLLVLVVGLGGGTGTGAAPVVARTAKEVGAVVLCIATLPFGFEGENRHQQARTGLRDLRAPADAVVVQANDRLLELAGPDEAVTEAFAAADSMLGVGIRALWSLITVPGVINLTFADVSQIVQNSSGTCTLGYGIGHGSRSADMALQDLLNSPLLEKGAQLTKAGAVLIGITAGHDLKLSDIQRIMKEMKGLVRAGAHILLGVTLEEDRWEHVAITALVAEAWSDPADPGEGAPGPATSLPADAPSAGNEGKKGAHGVQRQLDLGDVGKGRFKGVEPTLYEGQDLDVPTFIRLGAKLTLESS